MTPMKAHVRFDAPPPSSDTQTGGPGAATGAAAAAGGPRKRRRISRACDFCHRRSIRCKPSEEESQRCQNCIDFDVSCTYDRPVKKRGVPKKGDEEDAPAAERRDGSTGEHAHLLLGLTNGHAVAGGVGDGIAFELPAEHRNMVLANHEKIVDLVNVYFEVVYPTFPLFHRPTLLRKVATGEYRQSKALFASVMAICALAQARARDGALEPGRWSPEYFAKPDLEDFYEAARAPIPRLNLTLMKDLDWMRTSALLALLGIQKGHIECMHQYLGMYITLVQMFGFFDEANWPKDIGLIEIEERRRLYWSMYILEVYSSISFGGIIRVRESQSKVMFPSEINDEMISDAGYEGVPAHVIENPGSPIVVETNWMHGWNFTTELYRVLEHAMNDFHHRRPSRTGALSPSDLFTRDAPTQSNVLDKVMAMHAGLSHRFKEAKTFAANMDEDIFSFQSASIAASLQMVRMVLFSAEDTTVEQKCAIARELLDGFRKVPVFYLRAISSPLLHHVAGLGSILGSVIEGPISEASYNQVREVLLDLSDLLSSLEVGMTSVGAASRMRTTIKRIDDFMVAQRQREAAWIPVEQPVPKPFVARNGIHSAPNTMAPILPWPGAQQVSHQQQAQQHQQQPMDAYGFSGNMANGQYPNGQYPIQLPPELLESWPWSFEMGGGQGFNNF